MLEQCKRNWLVNMTKYGASLIGAQGLNIIANLLCVVMLNDALVEFFEVVVNG